MTPVSMLVVLGSLATAVEAQPREDLVASYGMRDPVAFARRIYAHASAPELERAIAERREADALAIAILWSFDELEPWIRVHRTPEVQGFFLYHPSLLAENPVANRELLDWALASGAPANACGFADGADPSL